MAPASSAAAVRRCLGFFCHRFQLRFCGSIMVSLVRYSGTEINRKRARKSFRKYWATRFGSRAALFVSAGTGHECRGIER